MAADMFRQIIRVRKTFCREVIFKFKLPPKPVPKIDLQEWKDMQKLMYELQETVNRDKTYTAGYFFFEKATVRVTRII